MKALLSIYAILILSIFSAQAQSYLNENSTWVYSYYFSFQLENDYAEIKFLNKSDIGGKEILIFNYSVIEQPNKIIEKSNFGLYEEADNVFYIVDESFYLLYDYSLEEGDTFKYRKPYEIYGMEVEEDSMVVAIVSEVSSIELDGEMRNTFQFNYPEQENAWTFSYVIEGIGDETFLFPGYWGLWDPPRIAYLRCYTEGQEVMYNTTENCYPISTATTELDQHFKVYPNPVSQMLYIERSIQQVDVQILNSEGKEVKHIKNLNSPSINVQSLESGIYLINILVGDENRYSTTLVKK